MIQDGYKPSKSELSRKSLVNSAECLKEVDSPHSPNPHLQPVDGDFSLVIQQLIQKLGVFPDMMARQKPYKAPVLKDYDGDLAKRWYVDFWVWSEQENKLIRKRKWLIQHDTVEQRRQEANELLAFLKRALADGLITPDPPKEKRKLNAVTLSQLMENVFKVKEAQNRGTSVGAYRTVRNNFVKYWNDKGGLNNVQALEKVHILEYLNYRQVVGKIENGTRNKELSFLKTIFNVAKELELITENPCNGIPRLKVNQKKDRVYTQDEIVLLRAAYAEKHADLLLFTYFVYYTYLRTRREARFMKVSHINIKDKLVFVPDHNAKNGNARYAKMPQTLIDLIVKLGIMDYNPEFFVFGNQGTPGARAYGKNTMYDRHSKIAKALGISGDVYSWKHTGIFMAYRQGIRMKDISIQCGHADLNETDAYFQKNGFYDLDREFDFK